MRSSAQILIGGAPEGTRCVFMGDEHGALILPEGGAPALADKVMLLARTVIRP